MKEKLSPTCMVEFRKQLCHCLRSANTFAEETGPDVILCHISMLSDDILRAGIVNTRNKLWLKSQLCIGVLTSQICVLLHHLNFLVQC